ncbi:hypothetical protein ACH5RR_029913 [Cinchona calisaya]|uniref:Protein TIFY n=1 Tax=Cinchona calisaya TaxID=153742 RepID=A0ABD2YXF3_9GENT
MERDFMGLNSRNSVIVVKEEAVDGFMDSGVPWPLSNKVSAPAPFMPFKASQDEKAPKVISDHLTSSGYMAMSSADAFDIRRQSGEAQNFAGATSNQQFLGGVPVAAHRGFVAGSTEPCTKASWNAAQLTIFFGGTVNVFDDITPEKAQAIMFLAGNGCALPNTAQTRLPVQLPASNFSPADAAFVNQIMHPQPSSALSSPISVSSHPVGQLGGGSSCKDDLKVPKTTGISTNIVNKVEPLSMMASLGPITAASMISSALPQAPKASLTRFLEKRKERAMNLSPYHHTKKSADSINPDSIVAGPRAASIAGFSSLSISN